jgi:copper ion binding protein
MKKLITIEGMSCGHCVKHVEEALSELNGVTKVEVSLKDKNATVELNQGVEDSKLKEAIEEAGYEVVAIKGI